MIVQSLQGVQTWLEQTLLTYQLDRQIMYNYIFPTNVLYLKSVCSLYVCVW